MSKSTLGRIIEAHAVLEDESTFKVRGDTAAIVGSDGSLRLDVRTLSMAEALALTMFLQGIYGANDE